MGKVLPCGFALCVTIAAVMPAMAAPPDAPPDAASQPAAVPPTDAVNGWTQAIEPYLRAARKNGYDATLVYQPDDRRFVLKLTKLGKTEAGHGILQRKWDEKDTIDLTLGKGPNGVAVENVSRDVMVKPPIGDWIKQQSSDVPAWVIAPTMFNG